MDIRDGLVSAVSYGGTNVSIVMCKLKDDELVRINKLGQK